ncbi:MAG: hypothetical protein MJB57_02635 [Gemmatimonadetes bacterium]|nr:hypothetical protein [Gemmatimonadota bacterium]
MRTQTTESPSLPLNTSCLLFGSAALLAACGGPGGASSSAVAAACETSSNLSAELCSCVSEKAEERLTAEGRELLIAVLEENAEETERLRTELPPSEAMNAGMFMAQAPAACAEELGFNAVGDN